MVFREASVAMNQVGKIKQIAELLEFIIFFFNSRRIKPILKSPITLRIKSILKSSIIIRIQSILKSGIITRIKSILKSPIILRIKSN